MKYIKTSATDLAWQAAGDFDKWGAVLDAIIDECPATHGIITLRNTKNSQLHIPTGVRTKLQSPIVRNFSKKQIDRYLSVPSLEDPWTPIEHKFPSRIPYALSDYIKLEAIDEKSSFKKWAKAVKICDSVVLELERNHGDWIALNVFHNDRSTEVKTQVVNYLQSVAGQLRSAWDFGRRLRRAEAGLIHGETVLKNSILPLVSISEDRIITSVNDAAEEVGHLYFNSRFSIKSGELFELAPRENKLIRSAIERHLDSDGVFEVAATWPSKQKEYKIILTFMGTKRDLTGKSMAGFSIAVEPIKNFYAGHPFPIWESRQLNEMQKKLARYLAEDGKITQHVLPDVVEPNVPNSTWRTRARALAKKLGLDSYTKIRSVHLYHLSTGQSYDLIS